VQKQADGQRYNQEVKTYLMMVLLQGPKVYRLAYYSYRL